jgi:hypothetical protein
MWLQALKTDLTALKRKTSGVGRFFARAALLLIHRRSKVYIFAAAFAGVGA